MKLFLVEVADVISEVVAIVGTGRVLRELDDMHRRARAALNAAYLREIGPVRRATSLMRQRARRHRNSRYRLVAELEEEFESTFFEGKWSAILRLLHKRWLEPLDPDDLFELYILVLLLVVLDEDLKLGPPEHGLIRPGRRYVAVFDPPSAGFRLEVYFDQSPAKIFRLPSEYARIVRSYHGVTGIKHRPDIVLCLSLAGDLDRRLLVEAKKTNDKQYKRDSIYKVLAYLQDFRALWTGPSDPLPRAILVFPEGVSPRADVPEGEFDLVLASATRARFVELLRRFIPTSGDGSS